MIRKVEYVSVQETRAQITREKLLESAIKVAKRDGINQLTVRNICDEAGLSTGSFYNLFSGKEDLISYYLTYAFRPYKEQALQESKHFGPLEKVLIIYRYYVKYCEEMGLEFVSGLYASNHNPFFDFLHRDDRDGFILAAVRGYLEQAQKEGIVSEDLDINEALLRIAAASTGILFYWCVFEGNIDVEYEADMAIRTYLRSIMLEGHPPLELEPLPTKGCFLTRQ